MLVSYLEDKRLKQLGHVGFHEWGRPLDILENFNIFDDNSKV